MTNISRRNLLALMGATGAVSAMSATALTTRFLKKTESQLPAIETDSRSSVGFAFDGRTNFHNMIGHPESDLRATRVLERIQGLQNQKTLPALFKIDSRIATEDEIALAHSAAYITEVRSKCAALKPGDLTYLARSRWSPYLTATSFKAAQTSAAASIDLLAAVHSGKVKNGFALTRPPGHHAGANYGSGYCLFNNTAVAINALRSKHPARIAILDLDAHHGNGTQDIYYSHSDVLYFSVHQDAWPYTGPIEKRGSGAGLGFTVNLPVPAGVSDQDMDLVFQDAIAPVLTNFKPECIVVSIGYDSHWHDYQGAMNLSSSGQSKLISNVVSLAHSLCQGKIAFLLEGGYHLEALADGVANTLLALHSPNGGFSGYEPLNTLGFSDPIDPQEKIQISNELTRRLQLLRSLHGI